LSESKKIPIGSTTLKPMGDREKGGNIMGAICSLPFACKQSAKYKKSRSIGAVSPAFCKKSPTGPA